MNEDLKKPINQLPVSDKDNPAPNPFVKKGRAKKERKPVELRVPPPIPEIDNWVVLGLDPSVSRTGFALLGMFMQDGALQSKWMSVGSARPDKIEDGRHTRTTLWIRSKQIALYIREFLKLFPVNKRTGLLISMEFPTPENDFLVGLNRIMHAVFFEDDVLADTFGAVRILTPNASTLRSLMGLKQRGATNKKENIEKAYTYVDKGVYPELDTDSCDAVLMAVMGKYTAMILMGKTETIPANFLTRLCNATEEIKGKGRNQRVQIVGVLHRSEYWYAYERKQYGIGIKDAANPKKALTRKYFTI
jgi:hypothetical protein